MNPNSKHGFPRTPERIAVNRHCLSTSSIHVPSRLKKPPSLPRIHRRDVAPTSKQLRGYWVSGADFRERLEIELYAERVHAVIDRTHRALEGSRRAGQLSRRLRRTSGARGRLAHGTRTLAG